MVLHRCPVCGVEHEVHPVLNRLAYGHQLTCSPGCKWMFTKLVRAQAYDGIAQSVQCRPERDEATLDVGKC